MRRLVASLMMVGCVGSTAAAAQARSGGSTEGQACALLPRDLVMKVSTAEGRKVLEGAELVAGTEDMTVARGASACDYGPILLVLDSSLGPRRSGRKCAREAGLATARGPSCMSGPAHVISVFK